MKPIKTFVLAGASSRCDVCSLEIKRITKSSGSGVHIVDPLPQRADGNQSLVFDDGTVSSTPPTPVSKGYVIHSCQKA